MWAAVAVGVGGMVVGAYSSSKASKSAAASADKASAAQAAGNQQQYDAAMAELDFAKSKQADWDSVYGSTQDNLADYYDKLTPERYQAAGVQQINEEYAKSEQNITKVLAQRGISNSGTAAAALTSLEQSAASSRAGVQAMAETTVANEKKSFLQLGLNQANGINQLSTSGYNALGVAGNNLATQSGTQAAAYNTLSQQAAQGVGTSIGQGISSLGQLAGRYYTPTTTPTNTPMQIQNTQGTAYNFANDIPAPAINNGSY